MKELIGKLSRGIVEYEVSEAEVSVTTIEKTIEAGTIFRGSFDVFDKKNGKLKGILYSTNEAFRLINNQFVGENTKIDYEVNAKYYEAGDEISGRINLVSNGGEFYVPYRFTVAAESIPTVIGAVSNIFQFMDLIKQEYDEALKVFLSEDFERIVLKDNVPVRSVYRGLIKGNDPKRAMEEFLLVMNKKQKVEFEISDAEKEYKNLETSYGDTINLTRNTWGVLDISVEVDGDFITGCKERITEEDFAGNNYEFSYHIDVERLHAGMNYGRIIFTSVLNRYELDITVDNVKESKKRNDIHEIRRCREGINQVYLDFRMRKCAKETWLNRSMELVERIRAIDDENPVYRLFQAQLFISCKDDADAVLLLDSVAENILDCKEDNIPLYCYYLYVRTLQKRDLEQTLLSTDVIRKYYENGYDSWELLWILFYTDPTYENNKSLKLTRIKEQFKLGCHSTLMYYEALYAFNKQPALLRVLNDYELQVLNFGSKYDAIDLRLANQIAELALLEKNFRRILFNILVKLYEKHGNNIILTALVSLLIRGNKTDEKYFKYYELAVKNDIQVTRLYEYYVFSMPEKFDEIIPNTVLMYFVYNGDLLADRQAFFYSKIIYAKENQPNVYKNYFKSIEKFAMEKLREGAIDKYIAVIYSDILKPEMVTEENEKNLPDILNTWELTLNDEGITEAVVIHKEINAPKYYRVRDNKALINIYTEDVIIMFKDVRGNIYLPSIDYKLEKLYENKDMEEISGERNQDNLFIKSKEIEQVLKYHKKNSDCVRLFAEIMDSTEINEDYKDYIFGDIIEYYTDHYEGDILDNYLLSLDFKKLSKRYRIMVMNLMITRGLYVKVNEHMRKYGIGEIDARKLLKFCTYILRENLVEKDDTERILGYCDVAFSKGKYNDDTLRFLCANYNGATKEMLEMWRVSNEFSFDCRELEERLLAQMMFSKTNISSISTIYNSYYKKAAVKIIKYAYLFECSYMHIVEQAEISDVFFKHLEDELMLNDSLPDVCKCEYLYRCSEFEKLSDSQVELCKYTMLYLESRGIIFDYYKKFDKWFKLSGNIMDKTTIVYRTETKEKVMINYYIETGTLKEHEYIASEMKQVFTGMYIKSFTLFYGEKINYYIMETDGKESNFTESSEHILDDRKVNVNESRFGKLNDILVCAELKDENMVNELSTEYYISNEITKELFK